MKGRGRSSVDGLSLDTGALIALERGDPRVRALLREAVAARLPIDVVAPVVARAWRDGARQARVVRLLASPEVNVPPLDGEAARAVGVMCARSGHSDVVDVHVALHARTRGHLVATSDPDDLRRVIPDLRVAAVQVSQTL